MKRKRIIAIIVGIILATIVVIYLYVATMISEELLEIIIWSEGTIGSRFNSDPEIAKQMDYFHVKDASLPNIHISLTTHPYVVHWFIGARCYYRYSVYDYFYDESGEIDRQKLSFSKGKHVELEMQYNFEYHIWEITQYSELIPAQ